MYIISRRPHIIFLKFTHLYQVFMSARYFIKIHIANYIRKNDKQVDKVLIIHVSLINLSLLIDGFGRTEKLTFL